MDMNDKEFREYLNRLPIRTVRYGGVARLVRYDEKNRQAYLLDSDGNFTGRVGSAAALAAKETSAPSEEQIAHNHEVETACHTEKQLEQIEETSSSAPEEQAVQEETQLELPSDILDNFTLEDRSGEQEKPDKIPKWLLEAGILFLVVAVLAVLWGEMKSVAPSVPHNTTPTGTSASVFNEAEETTPVDSAETTAAPTEIIYDVHVLAAADTLLPGDIIHKEDFELIGVSIEEYRSISARGGVYTDEDLESLQGFQIQQFIRPGQYLSYDAVGIRYEPINPWRTLREGQVLVRIPVIVEEGFSSRYLWGNNLDLQITVQTKQETQAPTEPEGISPLLPGVEHNSSIVESMVSDTYIFRNVVIGDILNSEAKSLLVQYSAWATIPAALKQGVMEERMPTLEAIREYLPSYVECIVSEEQAAVLQELITREMTLVLYENGPVIQTEYDEMVYTQMKETASVVETVWEFRQPKQE